MIPSRKPPAMLLAALALLSGGCAGMGGGESTSRELSSAQFDDVPVPTGFLLEAGGGKSFSYAEGGSGPAAIRVGRMEYSGRGDPDGVLEFYRSEMPRPIHGWDGGVALDGGRILFTRGDDRCLVTVSSVGGLTRIVVDRNTRAAREAG